MTLPIQVSPQDSTQSTLPHKPQAYTVDDNEDDYTFIRTNVHGTCARCKHFHKHMPFNIPIDQSRHKRLLCEKCGHPMFGLGRTSTQTTLASAESISISSPGSPPLANMWTCLDQSSFTNSQPHRALPSPFAQFNPLIERNRHAPILSSLRAEGQSETPPRAKDPVSMKDDGAYHGRDGVNDRDPSIQFGITHERRYASLRSGRFHALRNKIKTMLCSKPKDLAFHGHGLRLQFVPLSHRQKFNTSSMPDEESPQGQGAASRAEVAMTSPINEQPSHEDESSPTHHDVEQPLPGRANNTTEVQNGSSHHSQGSVDDGKNAVLGKLGIIRREKTLRHQALHETRCKCTESCSCKADTNRLLHSNRENAAADSMRCLSTKALPAHYLDRPLTLTDDSSDSHGSVRSAHPLLLEHTRGSSPSRDRFSQAATVRSNESSISLESRRSSYPERSSAPAMLPPRHRYRPIQSAMRNVEFLDHGHRPFEEPGDADFPREQCLSAYGIRIASVDG